MIVNRMGWTDYGLQIVQEEFAKIRRCEAGVWKIKMKSVVLEDETEEGLLNQFLDWCKKDVV
jgi:hypothetical protein